MNSLALMIIASGTLCPTGRDVPNADAGTDPDRHASVSTITATPTPPATPVPWPSMVPTIIFDASSTTPSGSLKTPDELVEVQKQADAYQARIMVKEADKAKDAYDYARARDLYAQAVALDPTNVAATEGRNEMLVYLGQSPDNAGEYGGRIHTHDNQIVFDFNCALSNVEEALSSDDLASADIEYKKAQAAAVLNPGIFSLAEIRQFNSRLKASRRRIDAARQPLVVGYAVGGCVPALSVVIVACFWAAAWRQKSYHQTGRCQKCGYDLTGNASGVCPECGGADRKTCRAPAGTAESVLMSLRDRICRRLKGQCLRMGWGYHIVATG